MAGYTKEHKFSGAYEISDELLKRLIGQVASFTGELKDIEVSMDGGHTLTLSDAEEVGRDGLFQTHEIREIVISGSHEYGTPQYKSAKIDIDRTEVFWPVAVELKGEKAACDACLAELTRDFASASQPYAFVYSPHYLALLLFSAVIVATGFIVAAGSVPAASTPSTTSTLIYVVILGVELVPMVTLVLLIPRYLLFRRVEFLIGRGIQASAWRAKVRKFVFGTLGAGIILGAIFRIVWHGAGVP